MRIELWEAPSMAKRIILECLSRWRELVEIVRMAIEKVRPDAEIYVVGGAAEDRLTILSDIDVAVVLDEELSFEKSSELRARILEEAEKMGLPLYAPIELHIVSRKQFDRYTKKSRTLKIR